MLEFANRLEEVTGWPGSKDKTGTGAGAGIGDCSVDSSVLILASDQYIALRQFSRQMLARIKK
jgi:hypothetical protein